MTSRPLSRWLLAAAAFFGLLLALAAALAAVYMRGRTPSLAPPAVIVQAPASGETAAGGSIVPVIASAFGQAPIAQVELWLDGQQLEVQRSAEDEFRNPFDARFELLMTEGPHTLTVRAVDDEGLVAQSLPIQLFGTPPLSVDETFLAVSPEEGQTLQDLAQDHGADLGALQLLNPDVGDGALPGDLLVTIPSTDTDTGDDSKPPQGAAPPALAPPPAAPPPSGPPLAPVGNFGQLIVSFLPASLVPGAPSGLGVEVADCEVRMHWQDNAVNETHFRVWMQGLGRPARVIATLGSAAFTGPAWFQFPAPPLGIYTFWVEAVNNAGAQPSEVVGTAVPYDNACAPGLATQLQLDVLDVTVDGPWNNVYCYISVEGYPEVRLPPDDSQFIRVGGGIGKLDGLDPGDRSYVFPIPEDNTLDLQGECWGWIGLGDLQKLGSFSLTFPSEQWDGQRLILTGSPFEVAFQIMPLGQASADQLGLYTYLDPTITAPGPIRVDKIPPGAAPYPHTPLRLRWVWDPPPGFNRGTGFLIYLNGKPYKQVGIDQRQAYVEAPGLCGGGAVQWQVAALSGQARSPLSPAVQFVQPECQLFAQVRFIDIAFGETADGVNFPVEFVRCDGLEAYYNTFINATGYSNITKHFWGGSFFQDISCGKPYSFAAMSGQYYNWDDSITVPINPSFSIPNSNRGGITFGTTFWDWDLIGDDRVAHVEETVIMPLADWPNFDKEYSLFFIEGPSNYGTVRIRVTGFEGFLQP